MNSPIFSIFCDGGSRGNPGPGAAAFIVKNQKGETVHQEGKYLGITTNNLAEYHALLLALNWIKNNKNNLALLSRAKSKDYTLHFALFLDSLLIVSQLNGLFKIKNYKIREIIYKIKILENEIKPPFTYNLIPREKNKEADHLVNQTLNKNIPL